MSDFKAKMHRNRFRLGLQLRPRCGSLQHSPDPLREGVVQEGKGRGGTGKEKRREKGGKEGKRERVAPCISLNFP